MQTIPHRVKKVRESLGLSMVAFAKRMGYDRNYLGAIEKGKREPGHRFIAQLEILEREVDSGLVSNLSPQHEEQTNPRALLRAAMTTAGFTCATLARAIGYEIGVVQAVVNGGARISQKMAEKIVKVLPSLSPEDLLNGSDHPQIISETGVEGTVGATPDIEVPEGVKVRYVPLLSWAQAGALDASHVDDGYEYKGVVAFNVSDRKAFAVEIKGESMAPKIPEGARAVVCPSSEPKPGNVVIVRMLDGDVMCKLYHPKDGGRTVVLTSWNQAYPPLEYPREQVSWMYPVKQIAFDL